MKEPKTKLILVVDDVADNRDMYAQFLSYKGFQVALAGDGQEGFDKALQLLPDLIVMDLSLPVMDGWEAIRQLKRNQSTKPIPVIALTAHAQEDVAGGAREAGCDGFLTKPCPPDELVKKIIAMLELKQEEVQPRAARQLGVQ